MDQVLLPANNVTLTINSDKSFQLNDVKLSKESLCVFLELLGFDVIREMTFINFYRTACISLNKVDYEELVEALGWFSSYDPSIIDSEIKERKRIEVILKAVCTEN
jgi:hypothetical protein